jgi:hypothetical protein
MNEACARLGARLTELTIVASRRTLEVSPLYSVVRSLICGLADLIPVIAGGVR